MTLPNIIWSKNKPKGYDKYVKNDILEVMANGTLNFTIKGINIGMKVSWNYAPPASGGDTFTSIKKGSKATLEIIQNKTNEIQKKYQEKVVVEIQPLDNFYEAEEYHQKYLEKNPQGYCHIGKCFFG